MVPSEDVVITVNGASFRGEKCLLTPILILYSAFGLYSIPQGEVLSSILTSESFPREGLGLKIGSLLLTLAVLRHLSLPPLH